MGLVLRSTTPEANLQNTSSDMKISSRLIFTLATLTGTLVLASPHNLARDETPPSKTTTEVILTPLPIGPCLPIACPFDSTAVAALKRELGEAVNLCECPPRPTIVLPPPVLCQPVVCLFGGGPTPLELSSASTGAVIDPAKPLPLCPCPPWPPVVCEYFLFLSFIRLFGANYYWDGKEIMTTRDYRNNSILVKKEIYQNVVSSLHGVAGNKSNAFLLNA